MLTLNVAACALLAAVVACGPAPQPLVPPPPAPPPADAFEPEPPSAPAPSAAAPTPDPAVPAPEGDRIRVGVIHSLSGSWASQETTLMNAVLMAIEEINGAGGVLGRPLEPVILDPASNWPLFAEDARRMLEKEHAAVVFGGHTSVSRKSMLPTFEELSGLLFYPAQHEGEETYGSVFYTGSVPNQSVSVVADYLRTRRSRPVKRWFVIGTDYVVPRVQAKVLTDAWRAAGVPESDVAVAYTPFGHGDYQTLVAELKKLAAGGPTAVLSLLHTESAVALQRELTRQHVSPRTVTVVHFGLDERDAQSQGALFAGTLLARSYFSTIDHPRNAAFKQRFASYARDHALRQETFTLNDDVEATYIGVNLWKRAAESTKSVDVAAVARALPGGTFDAPSGFTVTVDANHHLHKPYFLAEVGRSGEARVIWQTPGVVPPLAPALRSAP